MAASRIQSALGVEPSGNPVASAPGGSSDDSVTGDEMSAATGQVHIDDQHRLVADRHNLDRRDELRSDLVAIRIPGS